MANSFGTLFKITSFGESHSKAVGVVIDGCPPQIEITEDFIQSFLNERRPGQNHLVSPRNEADKVTCLSGLEKGITLGTPLCLVVFNKDARPSDYKIERTYLRPSHSDYTTLAKYRVKSSSGGGRASARETLARVAAGAVARKILQQFFPKLEVLAYVESIHELKIETINPEKLNRKNIYNSLVRCPDPEASEQMIKLIEKTKKSGDSLGGVVRCFIKNPPPGLGDPVFDKLDAKLAQAMLSIPAVKGFEIGSGFQAPFMKGSEHNDLFQLKEGKIATKTNRSGGIQAGISNGQPIDLRVAFKPTSTIALPQETLDEKGEKFLLELPKGRHDPCVLPRAVPIVEAMAYLTLTDSFLRQRAQNNYFS